MGQWIAVMLSPTRMVSSGAIREYWESPKESNDSEEQMSTLEMAPKVSKEAEEQINALE